MDLDIGKLKEFFKLVDTNNDGKISQKEIDAAKKKGGLNSVWVNSLTPDMTQEMFGLKVESTQKQPSQPQSEAANPTTFNKADLRLPNSAQGAEKHIAKSIEDIPQYGAPNRDARFYDISAVKLSKNELLDLTIDETTVMSDEQKKIISEYSEKMKDPGLGIKALHQQGVTGKGENIAIIDYPLEEHEEYSNSLIHYEEISCDRAREENKASMHGPSVTSIAVGKDVGVAPDAKVSYFAIDNVINSPTKEQVNDRIKYMQTLALSTQDEYTRGKANRNIANFKEEMAKYDKQVADLQQKIQTATSETEKAKYRQELTQLTGESKSGVQFLTINQSHITALNKILEQNKTLPQDKKISIASISWGFDPTSPDFPELQKTLERAKQEGLFVVNTAMDRTYGMKFMGADRNPNLDVNDPKNYKAAEWWGDNPYFKDAPKEEKDKLLILPMDHRTVADFHSTTGYRYEGKNGGLSWATPYLAGTYALARQVNPNITPEQFLKTALETSDECNTNDGTYVGRLINPQKLMDALKNIKSE